MPSYSVSLPLSLDSKFGFSQITSYKALVKQNLKMLLLTNPGEKLMDPAFGVGLKMYLFEMTDGSVILSPDTNTFITNSGESLNANIELRINDQVSKYLSYIIISGISMTFEDNTMRIMVEYLIPQINSRDSFLYIDTNNIIVTLSETLENPRVQRDRPITRNNVFDMSRNTFE
jgi:hypothetical protein